MDLGQKIKLKERFAGKMTLGHVFRVTNLAGGLPHLVNGRQIESFIDDGAYQVEYLGPEGPDGTLLQETKQEKTK